MPLIGHFQRPRAPEMFWTDAFAPAQIAIMPRPRGEQLEADLRHYADAGVVHLVSLLEDAEVDAFGLGNQPAIAASLGMQFRRFPITDHGTPRDMEGFIDFVDDLVPDAGDGAPVAIHCMAGIGRSSLTAAALLMRIGHPVGLIFSRLAQARGCGVPETTEQVLWFRDLALRYSVGR